MEHIEQHFRSDERPFLKQVDTWLIQAEEQYRPILTPFLNPREQFIVQTLANTRQIKWMAFSHFHEAERCRMMVYPDYITPDEDDFETQVMEVKYAEKFNQLHHPQVLGSLLGAGIHREMLGDIITDDTRFQFEIATPLASYVEQQVTQMGKTPVQLIPVISGDLIEAVDHKHYEKTTISSFRLDNIVATVYNISRKRAKELIQKSQVQVNYHIVEQPDFQLSRHDLVSVRRFGRMTLEHIDEQKTKKDKYRIEYSVIRK